MAWMQTLSEHTLFIEALTAGREHSQKLARPVWVARNWDGSYYCCAHTGKRWAKSKLKWFIWKPLTFGNYKASIYNGIVMAQKVKVD